MTAPIVTAEQIEAALAAPWLSEPRRTLLGILTEIRDILAPYIAFWSLRKLGNCKTRGDLSSTNRVVSFLVAYATHPVERTRLLQLKRAFANERWRYVRRCRRSAATGLRPHANPIFFHRSLCVSRTFTVHASRSMIARHARRSRGYSETR